MRRRLSQVLSQVILFSGLAIIAICLVIYAIVSYMENRVYTYNAGLDYNPEFHEHQNYWEADSR